MKTKKFPNWQTALISLMVYCAYIGALIALLSSCSPKLTPDTIRIKDSVLIQHKQITDTQKVMHRIDTLVIQHNEKTIVRVFRKTDTVRVKVVSKPDTVYFTRVEYRDKSDIREVEIKRFYVSKAEKWFVIGFAIFCFLIAGILIYINKYES